MEENLFGNISNYQTFTVNEITAPTICEEDTEQPNDTEDTEDGETKVRETVYLKSTLRKIGEDDSILYLRRTTKSYKIPGDHPDEVEEREGGKKGEEKLPQEDTKSKPGLLGDGTSELKALGETTETEDEVEPLLTSIHSDQIAEIEEEVEDEEEEVIEGIVKKKRTSLIDSTIPLKKTAPKEDLEILKRFEGIKFILDKDLKFVMEEDDEEFNATKHVVAPILSSLLLNVFELVVEERIHSIRREYCQLKQTLANIMNTMFKFLMRQTRLRRSMEEQQCKCGKKRGFLSRLLRRKESRRAKDCKCAKRKKGIVATQTILPQINTVDRAIQNVVYEIYRRMPQWRKHQQLEELRLDNSLMKTRLLRMKHLAYLDIEMTAQMKMLRSAELYHLGHRPGSSKEVHGEQPYMLLDKLLTRSLPSILGRAEENLFNKELFQPKINTTTILQRQTKKQLGKEASNVSNKCPNLNISLHATSVDVKVKPTTRTIFVRYGKHSGRLA